MLRTLIATLLIGGATIGITGEDLHCQIIYPKKATSLAAEPSSTDHSRSIGKKSFLMLRCRYADTVGDLWTEQQVAAAGAEVNRIFTEMSYGEFQLDPIVVSPELQLTNPGSYYAFIPDFAIYDARKLAAAAGLNYENFDFYVTISPFVSGMPAAGEAVAGGQSSLVHSLSQYTMIHELGHNLGLAHSSGWENLRPFAAVTSPPFPSNVNDYSGPFLFDPDTLLGSGDIRWPGHRLDAADRFDIMGGGGHGDFNAFYKLGLGWLTPEQMLTATANGTYRIYAFDQLAADDSRAYGLWLPGTVPIRERPAAGPVFQWSTTRYFLDYRDGRRNASPGYQGLEVRWVDNDPSPIPQTFLLDTQPAGTRGNFDAPLPLGRAFLDGELGLTINPVSTGTNTDGAKWMDVRVQFGIDPANHAPTLAIQCSATNVTIGEAVDFTAISSDPDGDAVSFYWEAGLQPGTTATFTNVWKTAGQYLVRCEATDGRGARVFRDVVVTVGEPGTYTLRGRIRTANGEPIAGVMMHNGRISEYGFDDGYVSTYSDSDGQFSLPNLSPGEYQIGGLSYEYALHRDGPRVTVVDSDVNEVNFTAERRAELQVSFSLPALREGQTGQIIVTRSGPLDADLPVILTAEGTAVAGADYEKFTDHIVIPAGTNRVSIPITALSDQLDEPAKELSITLDAPQPQNDVQIYFPGWQAETIDGTNYWTQTEPRFIRTTQSTAKLMIVDSATPFLSMIEETDGSLTLRIEGKVGATYVIERSSNLSDWTAYSTNQLSTSSVTIPITRNQSQSFYRSRQAL